MAQLLTMPMLGSTMEEGTILHWRKREGESVRQGEVILEVMTDKAAMDVESPADGVLRKILAAEETTVPVRVAIAILGTADEPIADLLGVSPTADLPAAAPAASAPAPSGTQESHNGGAARVIASPRARRLADQAGVLIAALAGRGTGPGGRIIERDVEACIEGRRAAEQPAPRATPLAARMAGELGVDLESLALGLPGSRVRSADVLRHAEARPEQPVSGGQAAARSAAESDGDVLLKLSGMRKAIADNVSRSAFSAPHVTLTLDADMTEMAALRTRLLPEVERSYGSRLSYNDLIIKAAARALGEHPLLNATIQGDTIRVHARKNIGVAVALDAVRQEAAPVGARQAIDSGGLVVPVVHDADRKSLGAISAELRDKVERARSGRFTPDDLADGTFTITNLGGFGIDAFDPILTPGQAAILGLGRIADRAVVVERQVVIRTIMTLCLSFDHRIVDGAPAARFLQRVKELLENPAAILV